MMIPPFTPAAPSCMCATVGLSSAATSRRYTRNVTSTTQNLAVPVAPVVTAGTSLPPDSAASNRSEAEATGSISPAQAAAPGARAAAARPNQLLKRMGHSPKTGVAVGERSSRMAGERRGRWQQPGGGIDGANIATARTTATRIVTPTAGPFPTYAPAECPQGWPACPLGALPLLREIHLGRFGRARRLQLEIRPRRLADRFRCQHLREAPDVRVVAVHRLVVVLARDRDAVLRPLELVLERAEVLVGLELRVVLGDGEQPAERRGQGSVRRGHLLEAAALDRAGELGARLRHLGEDGLLLLRVALHRLHQVGDQIGAPLQLHLDLRLGGVHLLVVGLDRVVAAAGEESQERGENDQQRAPERVHVPSSLLSLLSFRVT